MRMLLKVATLAALALGLGGCENGPLGLWGSAESGDTAREAAYDSSVNVTIFPDSIYTTAQIEQMNPTYYTAELPSTHGSVAMHLATVNIAISDYTYSWWAARSLWQDSTWYLVENRIRTTYRMDPGWELVAPARVDSVVNSLGGVVLDSLRFGVSYSPFPGSGRYVRASMPLLDAVDSISRHGDIISAVRLAPPLIYTSGYMDVGPWW